MGLSSRTVLLLLALLSAQSTLAANYFHGITAAGSKTGTGAFTCRTQTDWNNLANNAKAQGFKSFRIYSFDCNALEMASSAAAAAGLQVLVGIYVDGTIAAKSGQIDSDTQAFINAAKKYGTNRYAGLTVGNEMMGDSYQNINLKVKDVRNRLRSSGISTPVSTVHHWVAVSNNPILCSGDFAAANAHVYWDGGRTSSQTGDFIFNIVVPALQKSCPGKKIIISESGWPSRGPNNGKAVASLADERTALSSLNCACKNNPGVSVYAFDYDDQLWKGSDTERSFGIVPKIGLNTDIFKLC